MLIEVYQSAIILNLYSRAGDGTRTHDLLLGKETFYQLNYTRKNGLTVRPRGAESQNRTGDTAIFSRVLYQLSYLGLNVQRNPAAQHHFNRATGDCQARVTSRPSICSQAASGFASVP